MILSLQMPHSLARFGAPAREVSENLACERIGSRARALKVGSIYQGR